MAFVVDDDKAEAVGVVSTGVSGKAVVFVGKAEVVVEVDVIFVTGSEVAVETVIVVKRVVVVEV